MEEHADDLASVWANQGIALLAKGGRSDLENALPCFNKAIILREPLLASPNPWFRYNLIGVWMNRGDVLARLGGADNLSASLAAYDRALALLQALPVGEHPLFLRRLTLAWLNRGTTLLEQGSPASLNEARRCAVSTIALTADSEKRDPDAAAIGMKARQVLCLSAARGLAGQEPGGGPDARVDEAVDAAEESLELARHWRTNLRFQPLVTEFFRFGAQAYARLQPQFLAEFLRENLPLAPAGTEKEWHRIATQAVRIALGNVAREGFATLAAPGIDRTLETFRELRETAGRLRRSDRAA